MAGPVVLLGASNITRGFSVILRALGACMPGPFDLFAAHGHGRSYGKWNRIPGRALPGIVECGLWEDLAEAGPPTHAIVSDIGNDIVYGREPPEILGWVRTCLERMRGAQTLLMTPPIESIRRLSRTRFTIMRSILFPKSDLTLVDAIAHVEAVSDGLASLAEEHGAVLFMPHGDWYGFDPVHIRFRNRRRAWEAVLSSWPKVETPVRFPRRIRGARPAHRFLFGRERFAPQPTRVFGDGSRIFLY